MRLRNKKTGQEGNFIINKDHFECVDLDLVPEYNSLAELNEEWEDVLEEPKGSALDLMILTLTNFIENEPDEDKVDLEDCKQMLEKLKAWKRLKDKGFKFTEWYRPDGCEPFIVVETNIDYDDVENRELQKHLDLLFGE